LVTVSVRAGNGKILPRRTSRFRRQQGKRKRRKHGHLHPA
jgi:hypothetical protein